MADQGRWWKLWYEALSDPHLANLSIADFGRWAKFGTYLKAHGTDGNIRLEPPAKMLLTMLQLDTFSDLLLCFSRFPNCQISRDDGSVTNGDVAVTVKWANWRKYQIDSSAERQRRYRHRQAFCVTTKKRGEEKRGDEKKKHKDFPSADAPGLPLGETPKKPMTAYHAVLESYQWTFLRERKRKPGLPDSECKFAKVISAGRSPEESAWIVFEYITYPGSYVEDKKLFSLRNIASAMNSILAREARHPLPKELLERIGGSNGKGRDVLGDHGLASDQTPEPNTAPRIVQASPQVHV